ncbi:MAG: O-antigen ligase family protein [Candidatus Promineifilaceae bacterium]|nr:O-antigen ligase family protein [Candidatus Promineifilaceae bacterium]
MNTDIPDLNPTRSPLSLGLLVGLLAIIGGLVLAFGGPIAAVALLAAACAALIVLRDMEIGFWAVIAVVALLPFATIPIDIGLTPTFLDLGLAAVVAVWLAGLVTGRQRTITLAPITLPLITFILMAIFAFIFGLANGPLTPTLLRKFAELLISLGFVLVTVDYCNNWHRLERLVKVLLLAGAAASAVAIILWLMPDDSANSLLNILARLGYPGGWVIRYIEENPALSERAIGTSVDPNVLGGLLLMMGALAGPQLVAVQPLFRRRISLIIVALIFVALILTFSRSAMLGLFAGLAFVAALRYRRLLPYMLGTALVLLLLPVAQGYIGRFLEGFQGQDLATQMRFGEYKDALTLIQRYPLFGVGFAGTPDIDIYLGVANVYLTITQVMGLLGLTAFVAIIITVFAYAYRNRYWFKTRPRQDAIWLGLHAALVGGLVAGFFDHYLFNLEFHHAVTAFWLFVGLATAATQLADQSADEPATLVDKELGKLPSGQQ